MASPRRTSPAQCVISSSSQGWQVARRWSRRTRPRRVPAGPWTSPPSTPLSSSSAGSGPQEASTRMPSTSSNSTITWSSQRSRDGCAWASSRTASDGYCVGPTPVRSGRPCLMPIHWRTQTVGSPSSSGSATMLSPQRETSSRPAPPSHSTSVQRLRHTNGT